MVLGCRQMHVNMPHACICTVCVPSRTRNTAVLQPWPGCEAGIVHMCTTHHQQKRSRSTRSSRPASDSAPMHVNTWPACDSLPARVHSTVHARSRVSSKVSSRLGRVCELKYSTDARAGLPGSRRKISRDRRGGAAPLM